MSMNFCFPVKALTDCTKLLLQTKSEAYNIKNACVMQSHTCLTTFLPVAHPVCH